MRRTAGRKSQAVPSREAFLRRDRDSIRREPLRKVIITAAFAAALAASPALAQGQSGDHGPPDGAGGGPPEWAGGGGGNGGGPPIDPPGLSSDPLEAARAIAQDRGQFGRDFAEEQRGIHQPELTGPERAEIQRQRAAQYYENAQIRREQAQQYSSAMHHGAQLPRNAAATLRNELKADMESWRDTFTVGRAEWQAMRDQWLVDRDSLTAEQWAQRRLDWFAARDAWIARNRAWAQARSD